MGLGPETVNVGNWSVGKSNKKKEDNESGETGSGCWFKFRLMGRSLSSRSKRNGSSSGTSTPYAESKSTNDNSRDQPVVPAASPSTTTTSTLSPTSSTPNKREEFKISPKLRKFSYNELKSATRNFRHENLLGEGGFGCVYKGWINVAGTYPLKPGMGLPVAVKTLNLEGLQGHKEWLAEVNFLGEFRHPNLVKLIGCCIEDDQRLLVYEFMPRGSLENQLFRRSVPLCWSIRMKIALDAAKGLAFLHEEAEKPVIYRDFKTSNVLLDGDYNAKLSDFGLAKDGPEGDKTHVSTRVMGTYGYAAPEYVMTGHLTAKSDVYSFGVVLLEMLTGRRSVDRNRPNGEQSLVEWAKPYLVERRRFYRIMDPRLEGCFSIKGAHIAIQLAGRCISRNPKTRPLMSEVVEALKPVPSLTDMASSSPYFQAMQAEHSNSNRGTRVQAGNTSRNGQPMRSGSVPNGPHGSPYHCNNPNRSRKPSPEWSPGPNVNPGNNPKQSPKPNGNQP